MSKTNKFGKKANDKEKMIEVRVWLWTDGIAKKKGNIVPKNSWDAGVVYVPSNPTHGIKSFLKPRPFHSFMDLNSVIEKMLIAHGIKTHSHRRSQKYFAPAG